MVEPDSAEPIWKPRAACRGVCGVPGVVELGDDVGGEGRIIERAPVEPPVAADISPVKTWSCGGPIAGLHSWCRRKNSG